MTAHIRVREMGDEPATLNRALLTDLLRDELGFTGVAITDALEMKAISATVGVEQGAVQALAAGADALCLGHDLGADSVERIVRAVVEGVAEERLAEERLAEAPHGSQAWSSSARRPTRPTGPSARPPPGGPCSTEGEVLLTRPAVVVELRPEPTIAVDARNGGLGDLLATRQPDTRVAQDAGTATSSGQLVVVLQDAHRHEWQQDAASRLVEAAGDAIVVEVGLPVWRPEGAAGYVATHGAARVNVEAAVDRLLDGYSSGASVASSSTPGTCVTRLSCER